MKEQKHEWHHGELLPVPEESEQITADTIIPDIAGKIVRDRIADMNRMMEENNRLDKELDIVHKHLTALYNLDTNENTAIIKECLAEIEKLDK